MKVMIIDTKAGDVKLEDKTEEEWYEVLDSDKISILPVKIGRTRYNIVSDSRGMINESWMRDDFLFEEGSRLSAIDKNQLPICIGNLIICGGKGTYKTRDLSNKDIQKLATNLVWMDDENPQKPEKWLAIANIELK